MQYVPFGRTGIKVSRICLGTMSFGNESDWMLELDAARPIAARALDLGINFFDTADVYSDGRSEEIVGSLLRDRRDEVVLATKVYNATGPGVNDRGLSRKHIVHQVRKSLLRLQTDYIDLYQIHRWDYSTPIGETLRTFADLVSEGRVRYIGASSMFAWQFSKSLCASELLGVPRFVSMQNHYNLCYREEEREMIPLCKEEGVALIPWSPLARGFLSGKYSRGEKPDSPRSRGDPLLEQRFFRPEDFDVLEAVEEVAREKGVRPSQVALAWLFQKDWITAPIIGATKVGHIEEAVEALDVKLSEDDMNRIETPYKPHPILGHS